jgi:uncharacterized membrane protein
MKTVSAYSSVSDQTGAPKRVLVIDAGRGTAVLGLVIVHTLWMYADTATQTQSLLGHIVHILGKGTAAFLVWMGISMMLSRHQTFYGDIKRSLYILALGYTMNFLKFVVPIKIFDTMPENFIEAYGWHSPLDHQQLLYLFLTGDILQLAGLSLIMLAFIRRFIHSKYAIFALACFVLATSKEFSGYRPGITGIDYLADLFFATNFHVYFPVFPWVAFILFGMFLGMQLKEYNFDHNRLFRQTLWMGLGSIALGGGLCLWNAGYHFGDFFHLGPGGTVFLLGINFVLIWIAYLIVEHIAKDWHRVLAFLSYCSKNVTSIYVIQWVLICWGMGIVGYHTLNVAETLAMMAVMLILALTCQRLKDHIFTAVHSIFTQNARFTLNQKYTSTERRAQSSPSQQPATTSID